MVLIWFLQTRSECFELGISAGEGASGATRSSTAVLPSMIACGQRFSASSFIIHLFSIASRLFRFACVAGQHSSASAGGDITRRCSHELQHDDNRGTRLDSSPPPPLHSSLSHGWHLRNYDGLLHTQRKRNRVRQYHVDIRLADIHSRESSLDVLLQQPTRMPPH